MPVRARDAIWADDTETHRCDEGFEVRECSSLLSAREWSWMVASAALAAMLVAFVLFGACHILDGDCRIVWGEQRTLARVMP